ncbi:MAG: hypothetical protein JNL58_19840 [Planctomyces sp.]|nr:hypothetical protein [Planctomyces sp.]
MADESSASAPKKVDPAKKELALQLWERLGKSRPGPDNKDLIFIARFVPLLTSGAVKTLLARKLALSEIKELAEHVPRAQEGVIKLVTQMTPDELSEEDLRFFFTHTKSVDIARMLLKRFPTDQNLALVEGRTDALKEAIEKMRLQEKTRDLMREIERRL